MTYGECGARGVLRGADAAAEGAQAEVHVLVRLQRAARRELRRALLARVPAHTYYCTILMLFDKTYMHSTKTRLVTSEVSTTTKRFTDSQRSKVKKRLNLHIREYTMLC